MYEIEISNGMKSIDKEEWNTLVGRDFVESYYDWFIFLDKIKKSLKIDLTPVLIKKNGIIIGILPAYCTKLDLWNMIASFYHPLKKISYHPIIKIREMECHIPLTCHTRFFTKEKNKGELLNLAVNEILKFAKENKISVIFSRDTNEDLVFPGFIRMHGKPETYMPPQWSSWNEFLAAQKGKRGKHMRYEYKKSVKMGIETEVTDDLKSISKEIYELYKNVAIKNRTSFLLPNNLFEKMDKCLGGNVRSILAKRKNKLIGCLVFLENDHRISCKYAGLDYEEALDSYTYFRMIYDLIKMGINSKKEIHMEKTAYEAKIRRGFRVRRKYTSIKFTNLIMERVSRPFIKKMSGSNLKLLQYLESI